MCIRDSIDVAELEAHLQFHEILLHRGVVGELFLHDALHLPQRPFDPGDGAGDREEQKLREEAHGLSANQSAFSSLSLMLTKLYGGHGPEYLNVSSSSYLRLVSLTFSSNICSDARSTRNAALR